MKRREDDRNVMREVLNVQKRINQSFINICSVCRVDWLIVESLHYSRNKNDSEIEKIACREENRSTGKLFWQRLKAQYDEVDESQACLSIDEGVELPEPLWGLFKQAVFRHERAPLTSWLRMQTAAPSETAGKVICMALVRLSPQKAEESYHAGLTILHYMHRVGFKSKWPALFEAVRARVDLWLLEVDREKLVEGKTFLRGCCKQLRALSKRAGGVVLSLKDGRREWYHNRPGRALLAPATTPVALSRNTRP
eukprot:5077189-Amphidinium_carterae.2